MQFVVNALRRSLRLKYFVLRTDRVLRFFHGLERSRGKKRKDCRSQTDDAPCWHENRPAQHIGVNLIEDVVLLRNPARVDDAANGHSVLLHAIENDAGVQSRALDGGEQFVLRRGLQIPAEGDPAQIGIHKNGAIPVVPGHSQQPCLPRAIFFKPLAESLYIGPRARGDGLKNIAHGREPRFNAGALGMDTSLHHPANTWNQFYRWSDSDDAGGGAYNVDDILAAAACPDGVPMRVKCAHGNRDACFQAELLRPIRREMTGEPIRSRIFAVQFFAYVRQQRIHLDEEFFRGKAAQRGVPHPLMAHGTNAALHFFGVRDATQRSRDHVAVLKGRDKLGALAGIVPQPM